ncbi:MAG: glutathione peroxidase [Bacteroidia bacterium]
MILTLLISLSSMLSPTSKNLYDYSFNSIDGKEIKLSEFKGKKILFVNTASECGYTPQYKQLEELHKKHGNKLVVIGFPCNDFGGQEPGSEKEIAAFCEKNFGVSFLMAEKITVKGDKTHPIYKWLTSKELNGVKDSQVRWNFHKFLVDEQGRLIDSYGSAVKPMGEEILSKL